MRWWRGAVPGEARDFVKRTDEGRRLRDRGRRSQLSCPGLNPEPIRQASEVKSDYSSTCSQTLSVCADKNCCICFHMLRRPSTAADLVHRTNKIYTPPGADKHHIGDSLIECFISGTSIYHTFHVVLDHLHTSLIVKLPLAGVLYRRLGSDSHETVPSAALWINLNSNVDEIGN